MKFLRSKHQIWSKLKISEDLRKILEKIRKPHTALVQNEIMSFINNTYAYSSLIRLDLDPVVRFLARNLILEAFSQIS